MEYSIFAYQQMEKMKNLICLGVLLFSFCLSYGQKYKIGVIVDPQITWISPDSKNVDKEGSIGGINGGLSFDKYFQKNYAFHTGVTIGSQGGKLRYSDSTSINVDDTQVKLPAGTVVEYKLNYITVPLALKLKTNQIGYLSYYAQLGFTNQFNIKAKASSNNNKLDKDNISKEISFYNLAYHFGAGLEYELSEETAFTAGIIYNIGFIDLTDQSAKVYSRVLALSLGIIF
jgi:opacity protein-like surface antigen